jgi:serine/threonine protein kinase
MFGVFSTERNDHALVMEPACSNLSDWMRQFPRLAESQALEWLDQLMSAAQHIHALGIAHGNITLDNILVFQRDGEDKIVVKLADFGSACFLSTSTDSMLQQVLFEKDLFDLGVVFFQLLFEEAPFKSTDDDLYLSLSYGDIDQLLLDHGIKVSLQEKSTDVLKNLFCPSH